MQKMKSVFFIAAFLTNVKLLLSVSCPSPFTTVGSGCYYILSESRIDWHTANANCQLDLKGYLAEITNEQEQANIAAFIKRADPTNLFYYWIGGSDMQQEGSWRWMKSGNYFIYNAWDANQPDNDVDEINNTANCVHLWFLNNAYSWNDYFCSKPTFLHIRMARFAFKGLCEADPLIPCMKPITISCKEPEMPCEQTYD